VVCFALRREVVLRTYKPRNPLFLADVGYWYHQGSNSMNAIIIDVSSVRIFLVEFRLIHFV
jgi:hypothetical protein